MPPTLTSPQQRQHGGSLSFSLGRTSPPYAARLVGGHRELHPVLRQSSCVKKVCHLVPQRICWPARDSSSIPPLGIKSPTVNSGSFQGIRILPTTPVVTRRSRLGIPTAPSDKPEKPQGGLDGADIAFIIHITGGTNGGRPGQHLPETQTCFKGSQTKGARVLRVTLNYITSVCTCRGKRSRRSHTG